MTLGILIVVGTSAGGYWAYKTYDYVEHDNEFCFSCHLMQDPYELFAQSAHRDLGCKACHQPNLLERSSMGVTAIVENPDTIDVHSTVPNDLCANCHIEGDPEAWRSIASSAGHRVHLESQDSTLQGLQCVECHASSLHQFAAVDETCAQSGCHTESDVQLGAMSDLAIHCAACHSFSAPSPDQEGALAALAPDASTCLSCHAMRTLVELPDPDPHENACASCHNPHEQATPAEAAATCATSDCHADPVDLSPFHQGLTDEVVADCLYCHQAHDFHVDGSDCAACHTEIMDDRPEAIRRSAAVEGGVQAARIARADAAVRTAEGGARVVRLPGDPGRRLVASEALLHSWNAPLPQTLDFLHSEHPSDDCVSCHESTEGHGLVTVTTITDCRSCHHTGEYAAESACATCHAESGSLGDPYRVVQTVLFSTDAEGSPGERRGQPFDHDVHAEEGCATCHTTGLELSAAATDCASCHEEHHVTTTDCMACHTVPAEDAHAIETAHVTCAGAGCHSDPPFEGVPRTNIVCLSCHQDLTDHRPEGSCAECHALPEIGG